MSLIQARLLPLDMKYFYTPSALFLSISQKISVCLFTGRTGINREASLPS